MLTSSFSPEEKALLIAFKKHEVRYIIVGLSSAVLQGASVVTQDIDLWIENYGSQNFLQAVRSVGGFYIPPAVAGMNPPMLGPASLRIFDIVTHMHGLDNFETEYARSEIVTLDGIEIHILPLERIIISKTASNREKDRAVLPALHACLAIKNNLS